MGARFVSVDRETPMLLPPDLQDWVPEDDLVHFVIEAVERLPLEGFRFQDPRLRPGECRMAGAGRGLQMLPPLFAWCRKVLLPLEKQG